jgi:pilus assembly protein CpaB
MKPKTLLLMFVAIGCGLAASYMTSRLLADRGNKDQVDDKVTILVARKNLSMGTLIKDPESLFEPKQFAKGEQPKKAIQTYDMLKDRRLNKPIAAEQFVSADDLMDKSQDGLSALMPKGMRAFGVKVNAEASSGGFVLPNSKVDVVWVSRRGDVDSTSKIILQNVLVLAVDQQQVRPEDKQAMVPATVTLAVTPDQAERLSLAKEMGTLQLILRPFGDEEVVKTQGVNPKAISKGNDANTDNNDEPGTPTQVVSASKVPDVPAGPKTEEKPAPEPAPQKTHTLTIYNGEAVTKAVFILNEKDEATDVQVTQPEAANKGGESKGSPTPLLVPKPPPAPPGASPQLPQLPQLPLPVPQVPAMPRVGGR